MKKCFLLVMVLIAFGIPARGDEIGIYQSTDGHECRLAAGFSETANVVLKIYDANGATGVRFRIEPPDGSTILAFTTPYLTTGNITGDFSIDFAQCIGIGAFPIGTITAIWTAGTAWVRPAMGQTAILKRDCAFTWSEIEGCPAFFGGIYGFCCGDVVGTEGSTWGKVKSLYR